MDGEERSSMAGLHSKNMVRAGGKEVGVDDAPCMGPWLFAVQHWLPKLEMTGGVGKVGAESTRVHRLDLRSSRLGKEPI